MAGRTYDFGTEGGKIGREWGPSYGSARFAADGGSFAGADTMWLDSNFTSYGANTDHRN